MTRINIDRLGNLNDAQKFATFDVDNTGITLTIKPIRYAVANDAWTVGERAFNPDHSKPLAEQGEITMVLAAVERAREMLMQMRDALK